MDALPILSPVVIWVHNRFALWNWPQEATAELRREFPETEFVVPASEADLLATLPRARVLIAGPLPSGALRHAEHLIWVHSPAAAVHHLLTPGLVAGPVRVTNGRDIHGGPVAEHALAMMLAIARGLPEAVRAQARHHWAQEDIWRGPLQPRQLRGSTAVLIGLGAIGGELARLLKALGMTVLAVRAHPEQGAGAADEVHAPAALDDLLPRADYVVLALPVTPQSQALLDAHRLALLPPQACVINVGRGALLDQPALAAALAAGRLRAAALDVFAQEPLPPDSPLWDLPQALIVPHLGSATAAMWPRQVALIAANLRRLSAGQPLLGEVNKQRGY